MIGTVALGGCGYLGSGTDDSSAGGATLKILVHSNHPTDAAFEKINKMFEEQNPGVKIEFSTAVGTDFDTVKNTRLTAKDVDITEGSSQGGTLTLPAWVKGQKETTWVQSLEAGSWTDLTDEPFMKSFSAGVLDQFAYKGRQYAVPTGTTHETGVFYNKKMFQKYSLKVPTTWGELISVINVLKQHGETPFLIGGKDLWPAVLPGFGLVQSLYRDTTALDKGLWGGAEHLNSPTSTTLMTRLQTIFANTAKNWSGIDYSTVPSRFVAGEAAMVPDGSWEYPAIQTADPNFEFGYFPLPGADEADANKYLASKLEFSLAIPASSKNQELAKKWLALYASKDVYSDFITSAGFGPTQPGLDLPPVLADMQQYVPEAGFVPAWDQVWHPNTEAAALVGMPFAYDSIAPLGTESDMKKLADEMEAAWLKSLPK